MPGMLAVTSMSTMVMVGAPSMKSSVTVAVVATRPSDQLNLGRQLYITRCTKCHSPEPILKYSASKWEEIVADMAEETKLTARETAAVRDYVMAVLASHSKIVFCIAVDRNGYVATHNKTYCHPQRGDLAWDTANSRYRRIFNDRTGLASARNRRPFLLQTYRRDMGGGQFVVMKEAAVPISVNGQHWGGLRLAFHF